MKVAVVYYSATGNTAKVAKAIKKGVELESGQCDLFSVMKSKPENIAQYDLVFVGGPIWYYRETANLRQFIYDMPDMTGKLAVLFCSHGSSPEGFMFSLSTAIKKKGFTIIGWKDWYGSVYQVLHMPKPYLTDGHPDDIDLKEAHEFGKEMYLRAKRIVSGEKGLIPKPETGARRDPLWKVGRFEDKHIPDESSEKKHRKIEEIEFGNLNTDKPKFKPERAVRKVELTKCKYPVCTTCIDNCPINCIDFSSAEPVFKDSCINCALCDKMCPESAIVINEAAMMQRTQHKINMEKCTYPECTLCIDHCPMHSIDFTANPPIFRKNCEGDDLCWVICPNDAIEITNLETTHIPMTMTEIEGHPFVKLLEEVEAEGRFRRLVPIDEVGLNNIIYNNPKSPRFIIEEE